MLINLNSKKEKEENLRSYVVVHIYCLLHVLFFIYKQCFLITQLITIFVHNLSINITIIV